MSTPHITTKEVRRRYPHIIEAGNRWQGIPEACGWEKVGYNAGTFGWNYDVYQVAWDTCLVTGDRPPDGNVELDAKRMAGYEVEAREANSTVGASTRRQARYAVRRKVMNHIRRVTGNG